MKSVIYEIKKAIFSKTTVVLFAILLILPIVFAVSSAKNTQQHFDINSIGYGEGSNGTYNVSVFFYRGSYWTPVQGTNVTIFSGNARISGSTDANGFFNTTLHNLTSSEAVNLSYQYSFVIGGSTTTFESQITIGQEGENPYFSPFISQHIVNNKVVNYTLFQSRLDLMTLGVQGRPDLRTLGFSYDIQGLGNVPSLYLYYKPLYAGTNQFLGVTLEYSNVSGGSAPIGEINSTYLSNESQLRYFGKFQGPPNIPINTVNLTTNTNTTSYLFEVFSANGTELAFAVLNLSAPYSNLQAKSIFLSDELPLLGLFVPLMAVLTGFSIFGRSKLDGSLNYVVVRPISRRSLISSRFFSNIVAIFIPVSISMGISSIVFHFYFDTYIPASTIYLTLWALLVMAAGYTGLVYLASSMMKSFSKLVGTIIGIFILLDLFWSFSGNLIPSLITSGLTLGSRNYAVTNVILDYLSPSGFVNIVSYMGYGNTSQKIFLGNFIPAQVGIDMLTIISIGIAWIVIPFILSVIRFSRFD